MGPFISQRRSPGTIRRALRRKIPAPLRNPLRWRLVSGVILFAYSATHLINHALGNISLDALGAGARLKILVWDNPVGTVLLYGALLVHVVLGLNAIVTRYNWRLPIAQIVQAITGLAIPILLLPHIVDTRGAEAFWGVRVGYRQLLSQLWPGGILLQTVLLALVWMHGCIGIHQWLRAKPFYAKSVTGFAALATAMVIFAFTGFITGGRAVVAAGGAPGIPPEILAAANTTRNVVLAGLAMLALFHVARPLLRRGRRRLVIVYEAGDGGKQAVVARRGGTVLDASRAAEIPHASACNGRARCSTCRVLVLKGHDAAADPPNVAERQLLAKIKAPPNVRLACQYRPSRDIVVRRLVGAGEIYATAPADDPYRFGVEREVVALFADLRGFTGISERWLPYDVVHLLNAYFDRVARQIEAHGGEIDKFMGDGVMALFSKPGKIEDSARDALQAACAILQTVEAMNAENAREWESPLRVAIGVHGGPAIFGQIGGGTTPRLTRTALGRTINTASRLQDFAKTHEAALAVSAEMAALAEIGEAVGGERRIAELRGTTRSLEVLLFHDTARLSQSLGRTGETGMPAMAGHDRVKPV
ncbi:2Fe-2S iron-sulfur cluster-binding protein [Jiella sp. MQZ9-1]|uniref:2Fe-2S iron-sulfur cluster binding domain-containing protein n=1 Tax=Jiella flava TaxID=2816857 RepID=A0A939FVU3_9HYPH|nr:adenylate/guanylate cyclase domain-containing protein [Jiella flava]MBO0662385.1 2Fe-2S iron-sulfur cluster binding domain-containing protein [Jiella flava]MCD2471609.1 2Fe-2S iron-sulfur cluster-binding protein [Jiella flava]